MLNLKKVFKNYEEVGAINEHINLYGFIDNNLFLTKSGDIGIVLKTSGIDYEGLGRVLKYLMKPQEFINTL